MTLAPAVIAHAVVFSLQRCNAARQDWLVATLRACMDDHLCHTYSAWCGCTSAPLQMCVSQNDVSPHV